MMTNPRPERERTSTSSRRSSSSTTTREHGPGCVTAHDLEIIREMYVECIGELTPPVARMIEIKLAAGMEVGVILHAIEETGWAPRPSAQYLRAILTRLHNADILTGEQLLEDQARHFNRNWEMRCEREERWY